MRIDAHQHFWRYTAKDYAWIDDRMRPLRRDFLPADLKAAMSLAGVRGSIAVQARQVMEETDWLLELASASPLIRGVVGWAPIAEENFPAVLNRLRDSAKLCGLRHVVQAEPEGFLDGAAFNRGIAAMQASGLVYDILIFPPQLEEATRFVDRHPGQQFVLDHLGKPGIAAAEFSAWSAGLRELARRGNVACKLSGMVTEADWQTWSPELLEPYFETALEAFEPSRLMAGSDWPVLTVACDYAQWWSVVAGWLARLSAVEREQVEGGTAARIYGLPPFPQGSEGDQ